MTVVPSMSSRERNPGADPVHAGAPSVVSPRGPGAPVGAICTSRAFAVRLTVSAIACSSRSGSSIGRPLALQPGDLEHGLRVGLGVVRLVDLVGGADCPVEVLFDG